MSDHSGITRRDCLLGFGSALAASQLAGCCLVPGPEEICPFDPAYTDKDSLLTIDVHAHVFNATDLQVKEFVNRVLTRQGGGIGQVGRYFGGVLQSIAWAASPDTADETRELAKLKPAIMACESEANVASLRQLRQRKYKEGVAELRQEADRRRSALNLTRSDLNRSILSLPEEPQGLRQILNMPDTYEEFAANQPLSRTGLSDVELREVTLNSALKFVVEMFQYRFVSVYNYLGDYSAGSDQKIDLLTPAVVDYDWWLNKGSSTPSALPDQMRLMREISILSGGRVHALVPFDPFRQAVHDFGDNSGFSPIDLVRESVETHGALGVKLYPPMGFAPFGNQGLDIWRDKTWLPDFAKRADFPSRLDDSMSKLYEYCAANEVPVMGHSNRSNGPSDDFESLTDPDFWRQAASTHDEVKMSFGHFGGAGSTPDIGESQVEAFLDLLVADHESGQRRLQADASYFSTLLETPAELDATLELIYRYGPEDGQVAIDRLMYGSDWKMLAAEVNSEHYLRRIAPVIRSLQERLGVDTEIEAKFFGLNAVNYFGLAAGQQNRTRLENFYDRHEMRHALWTDKVDRAI